MIITIAFLLILLVITFIFGMSLGAYIENKQVQDSFTDAMDKANSMFLNSVDKIKESYETLFADMYADFKEMDEKRDNK